MKDGMDFTGLLHRNKAYGGANGSKVSVVIDDELYMLKFPAPARKNKNMSYANGWPVSNSRDDRQSSPAYLNW
ncbi:MAG: hypothetical protein II714_04285, partial [Oscillospiraceae bacterium]|nr:hypothetical protein [Oscillospiraceae bacterium]